MTLKDLYYGLMLPSGNDAAMVLAAYYGSWLMGNGMFPSYVWKINAVKKESLISKKKYLGLYVKKFMGYVNEKVVKGVLKHKNTNFENPHGLASKFQYSTAW